MFGLLSRGLLEQLMGTLLSKTALVAGIPKSNRGGVMYVFITAKVVLTRDRQDRASVAVCLCCCCNTMIRSSLLFLTRAK